MVIGVIQLSNRSRQAVVCTHYTTVKGRCPAPTRSGGPATPFTVVSIAFIQRLLLWRNESHRHTTFKKKPKNVKVAVLLKNTKK